MKTKMRWSVSLALCLAYSVFGACNSDSNSSDILQGDLRLFSSDEEFENYLENLKDAHTDVDGTMPPVPEISDDASAPGNENITNNQEAGVDEGGIVKNIGDYLVVLRKGYLYAASVATAGAAEQTDAMRVASHRSLNESVWYDEMLVKDNYIYVIGYRYNVQLSDQTSILPGDVVIGPSYAGATEINIFKLQDGEFVRLGSKFIESNDYFSGRNYASRLVDGKIVFYMPFARWGQSLPAIPRIFNYEPDTGFKVTGRLFGGTDVFIPLHPPRYPVFHTVTQCDLGEGAELDCKAKAILGDWWREHYVSKEHIYLWSKQDVYKLTLAGLNAQAHSIKGVPLDQFSFKEADNNLYVLTRSYETTSSGQYKSGMQVLTLPLQDFNDKGDQLLGGQHIYNLSIGSSTYTYANLNKFIGSKLVFSQAEYTPISSNAPADGNTSSSEVNKQKRQQSLIVHDVKTKHTQIYPYEGYGVRLESVSQDKVLMVSMNYDNPAQTYELVMNTLDLAGASGFAPSYKIQGAMQGEWRSHGFFYKSRSEAEGVFGLPILNLNRNYDYWYGSGVANIGFFYVDSAGSLRDFGMVSSTENANGECEVSCVDWYGNTRPIFLRDQVFALMGSELQELAESGGAFQPLGDRVVLGH